MQSILMAKQLLKKRQKKLEQQESTESDPGVEPEGPTDNNQQGNRRGIIPKQEKVDDIKLAKELLKKRKEQRIASPSPPSPEPEPIPEPIPEVKMVKKVSLCFYMFWGEIDETWRRSLYYEPSFFATRSC